MKRRDAIAALAAAGLAVTAGLYRFTDLFVKHYAPTPYDDLLARLVDREEAAKLGTRVPGSFDPATRAAELRARLGQGDLAAAVKADIAAGRLSDVEGWVLPETVAQLSALAAKV